MRVRSGLYRVHPVLGVSWLVTQLAMLTVVALGTGGPAQYALPSWRLVSALTLVALGLWLVILCFDLTFCVLFRRGFGLRRDHWIAVKWVLTVSVAAADLFFVQPSVAEVTHALSKGVAPATGAALTPVLLAQSAALVTVIVLGGRKPWSGREQAR